MKLFVESPACTSRVHCAMCRDREGGRAWRESLARAFELPADAPDFTCAYGVEWGATPPAPPPRQTDPPQPERRRRSRPGDFLELLIDAAGFKPASNCGCDKFRQHMNSLGWRRCLTTHRAEIIAWLVQQGARVGVTVDAANVWGLARAAWRARKSVPPT